MEKNAHKSLQNLEQLVNRAPLSRSERESLSGDVGVLEQVLNEFVKVQQRADELKKVMETKNEGE